MLNYLKRKQIIVITSRMNCRNDIFLSPVVSDDSLLFNHF